MRGVKNEELQEVMLSYTKAKRIFAFIASFLIVSTGFVYYGLYSVPFPNTAKIQEHDKQTNRTNTEIDEITISLNRSGKHQKEKKKKLILLYTKWFKGPWYLRWTDAYPCHVPWCTFSYNRSLIHQADAVAFHDADMPKDFPQRTRQDQVWIYHNMESPINSKTRGKRYNGIFNWTMSYRVDSDVFTPYGNFIPLQYHATLRATKCQISHAAGKTQLIAWIVSSCRSPSGRSEYARKLAEYLPIHVFGKCGKLTCAKGENETFYAEECRSQLRQHKFYLGFENSLCEDYITEKYWKHGFQNGLVPIVLGGADYRKLAIPGSYINVQDFHTVKQLAEHIKYLDNNDTAYNEYFEWKKHYRLESPAHLYGCALCTALHSNKKNARKIYENFDEYWHKDKCYGRVKIT